MSENGTDTDTDFQLPAQHVASLDDVEEAHRVLYIKEGNGRGDIMVTVTARMHT